MRLFILCLFLLASPAGMSDTLTTSSMAPCFRADKAEAIGKDIEKIAMREFCAQKIDPKSNAVIVRGILSSTMTKAFLGVEPPTNWQMLADEILKTCVAQHNLCDKEKRKEFMQCLKPTIPLFIVQFGPWIADNCNQINQALINEWPQKKQILIQAIKEIKQQNLN